MPQPKQPSNAPQFAPHVLTANHLLRGHVVYLCARNTWGADLAQAQVFTDATQADAALKRAQAQPDLLVGAYLAPVQPGPTGPRAIHFREAFRATGPSARARGLRPHA